MTSDAHSPPYWRVIEPYWERISIYDGPVRFLREYGLAPSFVGVLFATHWLQSEVRNGGFGQFFMNSTGVLAPEASEGFLTIGMPKAGKFVGDLIGGFGTDYPRDENARWDFLELLDDEVMVASTNPLQTYADEDFFDLLRSENGGFLACANAYAGTFKQ